MGVRSVAMRAYVTHGPSLPSCAGAARGGGGAVQVAAVGSAAEGGAAGCPGRCARALTLPRAVWVFYTDTHMHAMPTPVRTHLVLIQAQHIHHALTHQPKRHCQAALACTWRQHRVLTPVRVGDVEARGAARFGAARRGSSMGLRPAAPRALATLAHARRRPPAPTISTSYMGWPPSPSAVRGATQSLPGHDSISRSRLTCIKGGVDKRASTARGIGRRRQVGSGHSKC